MATLQQWRVLIGWKCRYGIEGLPSTCVKCYNPAFPQAAGAGLIYLIDEVISVNVSVMNVFSEVKQLL